MNNQKLLRGAGLIYRYHKLNHSSCRSWILKYKPICASTEIELSNWLSEKPLRSDQPRAIFSSCQKFGQGQFGRYWYSPKGGVWVSAAIHRKVICEKNTELYGLALAYALVEVCEQKGINTKIKWPNDLLVDGKKLAGVLPRLFFRGRKLRLFRVGVGLNVFNNVPDEGISLQRILGNHNLNINYWSSEVLFAIERSLDLLNNKKELCSKVEQKLCKKKYIDKTTGYKWDIKGIDSSGRLIVFNGNKKRILNT